MQPFECYQTYVALKTHFNSDRYDYFRSNGKVKVTEDSFSRRNDRFFFEKLAKKYSSKTVQEFLLANFVADNGMWIGESFNDEAMTNYYNWKKRVQALSYNFKQEIELLPNGDAFEEMFQVKENEHPTLLRLYLQKEVSLETFVILNEILNFFPRWNSKMKYDVVWQDVRKKAKKYRQFLVGGVKIEEFRRVLKSQVLG